MKTICICEKPSVARSIARVLGVTEKTGRILEWERICRHMNLRPSVGIGPASRLRHCPCGKGDAAYYSRPVQTGCPSD